MGTKNGKWDGKGNPPSLQAAIAWLESQGLTRQQAGSLIPTSGVPMADLGRAARRAVQVAEEGGRGLIPKIDATSIDLLNIGLPGQRPRGKGRTFPKTTTSADKEASASTAVDANGDGQISDDIAAQADAAGLDIFADLPAPGAENARGAPLWPYNASDDALAGLTVEDRSKLPNSANPFDRAKPGDRTGARYFEADTLAPLRWSQEQRADLQRLMQQIGLYGDKKVRLGSWGAEDQAIFAEVLAASNVEGTRWVETLAGWRRNPPADLLEQIQGSQPKRPTIQVTNPMDIRQAGQQVSQQLTGAVDRGFTEGLVAPYQGAEAAAQGGVYGDQEGGGGGTVTQAPSLGAFAEDKLRREKPLEVDGYQFLGQFEQFLSMLGVQ